MPTTSDDKQTTTNGADRARSGGSRADVEREIDDARRAGEDTVGKLVTALTDAVTFFVPPVVLRPVETVDVMFQIVEEMMAVQRRALDEVLATARSYVDRSDLGMAFERSDRARSEDRAAARERQLAA